MNKKKKLQYKPINGFDKDVGQITIEHINKMSKYAIIVFGLMGFLPIKYNLVIIGISIIISLIGGFIYEQYLKHRKKTPRFIENFLVLLLPHIVIVLLYSTMIGLIIQFTMNIIKILM